MTEQSPSPNAEAEENEVQSNNARQSIINLAKRSASWTVVGQILSQGLRLGSNIVLASLLFPEAFGLTAIVGVFLFGLAMLSDAGIGASVVQNKRGDDPLFLRTAWSMQVVRGFIIGIIAVLIAQPVANFYEEPQLFYLLCVAALGPVIQSMGSVSLHIHQRKLMLGPVVRLELISQVAQTAITIVWAILSPNVWALVGGTLIGRVIHCVLSHYLLTDFKHKLSWDLETFRSIFHFGRWILLSSALTFVVLQTDRLLLGHYLDMAILGVYTIGLRFSEALSGFQTRLTYSVLFPLFSQTKRSSEQHLVGQYYRVRFPMEVVFLSASAVLLVFGADLINLIFDPRYAEAGWMLQLLAIQTAMSLILTTQETLLFSIGHTYYGFARSLAKAIWIVIGIPVSYHFYGLPGIVWCVALSEIPTLLVIWFGTIKHKLLKPLLEMRAVLVFGSAVGLAYFVRSLF